MFRNLHVGAAAASRARQMGRRSVGQGTYSCSVAVTAYLLNAELYVTLRPSASNSTLVPCKCGPRRFFGRHLFHLSWHSLKLNVTQRSHVWFSIASHVGEEDAALIGHRSRMGLRKRCRSVGSEDDSAHRAESSVDEEDVEEGKVGRQAQSSMHAASCQAVGLQWLEPGRVDSGRSGIAYVSALALLLGALHRSLKTQTRTRTRMWLTRSTAASQAQTGAK